MNIIGSASEDFPKSDAFSDLKVAAAEGISTLVGSDFNVNVTINICVKIQE